MLDDLMEEGGNDKRELDLFTKHSHYQNITVIYLCQDMFTFGKYDKSISRNAHYITAFKDPRDQFIGDAKSIAASLFHTMARRTRHVSKSAQTSVRLHNLGLASKEAMMIFKSVIYCACTNSPGAHAEKGG